MARQAYMIVITAHVKKDVIVLDVLLEELGDFGGGLISLLDLPQSRVARDDIHLVGCSHGFCLDQRPNDGEDVNSVRYDLDASAWTG